MAVIQSQKAHNPWSPGVSVIFSEKDNFLRSFLHLKILCHELSSAFDFPLPKFACGLQGQAYKCFSGVTVIGNKILGKVGLLKDRSLKQLGDGHGERYSVQPLGGPVAVCRQPTARALLCSHLWCSLAAAAQWLTLGGQQSSHCKVEMLLSENNGLLKDIKD